MPPWLAGTCYVNQVSPNLRQSSCLCFLNRKLLLFFLTWELRDVHELLLPDTNLYRTTAWLLLPASSIIGWLLHTQSPLVSLSYTQSKPDHSHPSCSLITHLTHGLDNWSSRYSILDPTVSCLYHSLCLSFTWLTRLPFTLTQWLHSTALLRGYSSSSWSEKTQVHKWMHQV